MILRILLRTGRIKASRSTRTPIINLAADQELNARRVRIHPRVNHHRRLTTRTRSNIEPRPDSNSGANPASALTGVDQTPRRTRCSSRPVDSRINRAEMVSNEIHTSKRTILEAHTTIRTDRSDRHIRIDRTRPIVHIRRVRRSIRVRRHQHPIPLTLRQHRRQIHHSRIPRRPSHLKTPTNTGPNPASALTGVDQTPRRTRCSSRPIDSRINRAEMVSNEIHTSKRTILEAHTTIGTDRSDRHIRIDRTRPIVHIRRVRRSIRVRRHQHPIPLTLRQHRRQIHHSRIPRRPSHLKTPTNTGPNPASALAGVDQTPRRTRCSSRPIDSRINRAEMVSNEIHTSKRTILEAHTTIGTDRSDRHIRIDRTRPIVHIRRVRRSIRVRRHQHPIPLTLRQHRRQIHHSRIPRRPSHLKTPTNTRTNIGMRHGVAQRRGKDKRHHRGYKERNFHI